MCVIQKFERVCIVYFQSRWNNNYNFYIKFTKGKMVDKVRKVKINDKTCFICIYIIYIYTLRQPSLLLKSCTRYKNKSCQLVSIETRLKEKKKVESQLPIHSPLLYSCFPAALKPFSVNHEESMTDKPRI